MQNKNPPTQNRLRVNTFKGKGNIKQKFKQL